MLFRSTDWSQLSLKEWEDLSLMTASQITLSLVNLSLKEQLQLEAIRDPLTGLFNRRYMQESLEREFNRALRYNHPVAVIMMDIDHFKSYNDRFGHIMGDVILKKLAALIMSTFRGEDITCRYGGDEMVIILPTATLPEARERAIDLTASLKSLFSDNLEFKEEITLSIGIAIFPDHGFNAQEILTAADTALYRAKLSGRNRIEVASV